MGPSAKRTLETRGTRPRKSLGQNFLTDPNLLAHIIASAEVTHEDIVLEIGPGLGHLTRALAAVARQVIAVELDAALAENLTRELASENIFNVRVVPGDILEQDPANVMGSNAPYKVVANIPYYITSSLIRHLLNARVKPSVVVLTVQRQVAQRLTARPPHSNLLAVSVQFFARAQVEGIIPAGAFYPRPKVDSAWVKLEVYDPPPHEVAVDDFFRLVRAGFSQPRKQLRNVMAHGLGITTARAESLLLNAEIDPTRRPETIALAEWVTLAHGFKRK